MSERAVCPECGAFDVTYFRENTHPYYCWVCGARFDNPDFAPVEVEDA